MGSAIFDLYRLFDSSQRRAAWSLIALMLGAMVLETVGIGAIAPAMLMLTSNGLAEDWPELSSKLASAGISGDSERVAAGMVLISALFALKCVYVSLMTSMQMRFVYRMQADISRRLFSGYLAKPWTYHLHHNSAELIRNVVNATNELTMTGLVSLLILATELMVLFGIALLLLWLEPVGSVVAGVFLGSFGLAFNTLTRSGIRRASEARQLHETMRIRTLQQALGGLKDLTVLGRRSDALAQYEPHNRASAQIGQWQATLQALPKLWLELLAVLGIAVLVLTLVWRGASPESLIPILAVFAAAAFRLIPSMNRILGSLQHIRYSVPTIRMLREQLAAAGAPADEQAPRFRLDRGIAFNAVAIRYPKSGRHVLSGASFEIAAGTTVGIIGGSGAGKSTLVDAMLGLLPVESGCITADGRDVADDITGWQRSVGYVPQTIFLVDDSIRRNIAFGLPDALIDDEAVARAVESAQLGSLVSSLEGGLATLVGERGVRLSGGERQRIGIARALYHDPLVLVLDEATSALDLDTEADVLDAVNQLHGRKTIIMITHRPSTLRYCDAVYRIENGSVVHVATGRNMDVTDS